MRFLKINFFLITLFLLTAPNRFFAQLPPFYASQRELLAILEDPRLSEALGSGQLIQQICRFDGSYVVQGTKSWVGVKVHYLTPDKKIIGPGTFELEFFDPKNENGFPSQEEKNKIK